MLENILVQIYQFERLNIYFSVFKQNIIFEDTLYMGMYNQSN